MKATSASNVYQAIRESTELTALPRLIAEWNYNQYDDPVSSNIRDESDGGYDLDRFPIDSIIETHRPGNGIVKARVGEARVATAFVDAPQGPRYYVAGPNSKYKYWTSPSESSDTIASGSYPFANHTDGDTIVRPKVVYTTGLRTNKIVVGIEDSWASPAVFELSVKVGGSWSVIGNNTNLTISPQGRITLYWTGTWQESSASVRAASWAVAHDSLPLVEGVQLKVESMDRAHSHFNLIELSARLERNLTDYLVNASNDEDVSAEVNDLVPIGRASMNTGSVQLFNGYVDDDFLQGHLFNDENTLSPYFGLIKPGTKFTLDYIYETGSGNVAVPQFVMYAERWASQAGEDVSVSLKDFSMYMEQMRPNKLFYENLSAAEIIWRLCDTVGFNDYVVNVRDDDAASVVPFFWSDGEKSLWEYITELTEGTQIAVYFDADGKMQITTRREAYNETRPVDWVLRGEDSGTELADIVNLEKSDEYTANHVTVNYQTTGFSNFNKGFPKQEIVWEPEGTVVLRCADLKKTLETDAVFFYIKPQDARIWPYEGIVNIQGELIRYDGKQYVYYEDGIRKTTTVRSKGDLATYRNKTVAGQRHKNHFTGAMRITERGVWNSENKRHPVDAEGYNVRRRKDSGSTVDPAHGFKHIKDESIVRLNTHPKSVARDYTLATRGQVIDNGFYHYGTRMKFNKGNFSGQMAGLVFHNNGVNEAGYYVEIRPTRFMTPQRRKWGHEVVFYSRLTDGSVNKIGGRTIQIGVKDAKGTGNTRTAHIGVPHAVTEGIWLEVDVDFMVDGDDHLIRIYINGQLAMAPRVQDGSGLKQNWNGKFGLYARGVTSVDFEYLYAISRQEPLRPDDLSFFDVVEGGYISRQPHKEWVWRTRDVKRRGRKRNTKETARYSQMFFDEFGPLVHEVREFDVKFEPSPVLHSSLYVSNDYEILCPEYQATPFSAEFVLANAARRNAVAAGDDSSIGGVDSAVTQHTVIYGNSLNQKDVKSVVVKDEDSIRRRGKLEVEINSPWIQDKKDAKDLGDWINQRWSDGCEELTVDVFGNTLFEMFDLVQVQHPRKSYSGETFFVVGMSTTFDAGLTTTLTLRKANI